MKITSISSVVVAAAVLTAGGAHAQRPPRNGGGGGVTCPDEGGFSGTEAYMGAGAKAAPLRGAIGCVDAPKPWHHERELLCVSQAPLHLLLCIGRAMNYLQT